MGSFAQIARPGSSTRTISINTGVYIYNDIWYVLLNNDNSWDLPDVPAATWNAYKSTDNGQTWALVDTPFDSFIGGNFSGSAADLPFTRYGDKIYFVWQESNAGDYPIKIGYFDLTNETWDYEITDGTSTIIHSDGLLEYHIYYNVIRSYVIGDTWYILYAKTRDANDRIDIAYDTYDLSNDTFLTQGTILINGDDDNGRSYFPVHAFIEDDANWGHFILASWTQDSIFSTPAGTQLHHIAIDGASVEAIQTIETDIDFNRFAFGGQPTWGEIDGSNYIFILGSNEPLTGVDSEVYILYAAGQSAAPTWNKVVIPPPTAPYETFTTDKTDAWNSYLGSLAIIDGQLNIFISTINYDEVEDEWWTKLWQYTLGTDLTTWSDPIELWASPRNYTIKSQWYSHTLSFNTILFSAVNDSLEEAQHILNYYILAIEEGELYIVAADSISLSDAISLELEVGSGDVIEIPETCPPIVVDSAFCTGFKEYSAGNEDANNNCGNKFYEIQTEQCVDPLPSVHDYAQGFSDVLPMLDAIETDLIEGPA